MRCSLPHATCRRGGRAALLLPVRGRGAGAAVRSRPAAVGAAGRGGAGSREASPVERTRLARRRAAVGPPSAHGPGKARVLGRADCGAACSRDRVALTQRRKHGGCGWRPGCLPRLNRPTLKRRGDRERIAPRIGSELGDGSGANCATDRERIGPRIGGDRPARAPASASRVGRVREPALAPPRGSGRARRPEGDQGGSPV